MLPTLRNKSIVFVLKYGFTIELPLLEEMTGHFPPIEKADLIVLLDDHRERLVKRVIGLPGDTYRFKNQQVYINSKLESGKYLIKSTTTHPPNEILSIEAPKGFYRLYPAGQIPDGYYLVLGDNRDNSKDSRNFGLVASRRIRGKVLFTIGN